MAVNIEPNILDQHDNIAYHIRLYILKEKLNVTLPDYNAASATNGEYYILAETGASRVGINNLVIDQYPTTSVQTKTATATNMTFDIIEYGSVRFFDDLANYAREINLDNLYKSTYYLEVSFKGRYASSSLGVQHNKYYAINGRKWVFPVLIQSIDAKLTATGATYSVQASITNDFGLSDMGGTLGADCVVKNVKSAKDVFDQIALSHNLPENQAKDTSKNDDGTESSDEQTKYEIHPNLLEKHSIFFDVSEIHPDDLKFASMEEIKNRAELNKNIQYAPSDDSITLSFSKNTSFVDIIDMTMSLTKLAKREVEDSVKSDQHSSSQNTDGTKKQKNYVIKNLYKVYTRSAPYNPKDISTVKSFVYDRTTGRFPPTGGPLKNDAVYNQHTNDYSRVSVFYIRRFKEPSVLDSINVSTDGTDQIMSAVDLKKVYYYNYTGQNTQVIDFNINFKFGFYAAIPSANSLDKSDGSASVKSLSAESINTVISNVATGKADLSAKVTEPTKPIEGYVSISPRLGNDDSNTAMAGESEGSRTYWNALLSNAMSPADMISGEFKLRGDPYWLGPGLPVSTNQYLRLQFDGSDESMRDMAHHVAVIVLTPEEADATTGLTTPFEKRLKLNQSISGLYQITKISHSFSDNNYLLDLSGYRLEKVSPAKVYELVAKSSTTAIRN